MPIRARQDTKSPRAPWAKALVSELSYGEGEKINEHLGKHLAKYLGMQSRLSVPALWWNQDPQSQRQPCHSLRHPLAPLLLA